jgi:hypothetical protein
MLLLTNSTNFVASPLPTSLEGSGTTTPLFYEMDINNSMFCCVFCKPAYQLTTLFHEMESRKRSRNSDTGLYQRPCERRSRVAGDLHLACERDQRDDDVATYVRRSTSQFEGTGFFAKRLQVRPRRTRNSFRIPELKDPRPQLATCSVQHLPTWSRPGMSYYHSNTLNTLVY